MKLHDSLAPLALSALLCAPGCQQVTPASPQDTPPARTPVDSNILPQRSYQAAQEGFVVHEWGTLTSVIGSDGVTLPGLHHEEEDLPAFVSDRLAQARSNPALAIDPIQQKMETPVTYFYTSKALTVSASVDFPQGLLTQWFPEVQAMNPPVFLMSGQLVDRYSQALSTIPDPCQYYFSNDFNNGMLDWGKVDVLDPADQTALPGDLGKTTWGFARNTASNRLRVKTAAGPQHEKFLFYRGLGNFGLPLQVAYAGGAPQFRNGHAAGQGKLGGLVLMVVTKDAAGYVELGDLAEGTQLSAMLPTPTMDHQSFVASLKVALARRLIEDGLYTDEALAMVDTWERSYFLTPGTRLIYLLPAADIDTIIPLHITPAPDRTQRVMVIRAELLSPADEATLSAWLTQLGHGDAAAQAAARASFLGLGRFAEPHLSRALALSKDKASLAAGQALLAEVQARRRWAPTAAE